MTHGEKQKIRRDTAKRGVMSLLRMSKEQYSHNEFEFAYGYIEKMGCDSQTTTALLATKSFWIWWRIQYGIADEKFLNEISEMPELYSQPMREIENLYKLSHIELGVIIDDIVMERIIRETYQEIVVHKNG